jgi:hypothetical protein
MASGFPTYAIHNADLRREDIPPVTDGWNPQLVRFALSFDGYEYVACPETKAVVALAALARPVAAAFVGRDALPPGLPLSALRACLFWEQRRSRYSDSLALSGVGLAYVRALLDAIQASIGAGTAEPGAAADPAS